MIYCSNCRAVFKDLTAWHDLGKTRHPYQESYAEESNGIACPDCGAENTNVEKTVYCACCGNELIFDADEYHESNEYLCDECAEILKEEGLKDDNNGNGERNLQKD